MVNYLTTQRDTLLKDSTRATLFEKDSRRVRLMHSSLMHAKWRRFSVLLLGSSCVVGAPAGGMLGAKHRSNGACAGSLLRCAKGAVGGTDDYYYVEICFCIVVDVRICCSLITLCCWLHQYVRCCDDDGQLRHVGSCIQRVYTAHKLKLPKPGSSVANTGLRDRGLASSSLKHFSGQCC